MLVNQGLNRLLPLGEMLAGEVDADEPAVGRSKGHGDQVAPAGTAQLENAAAICWRRAQAEQGRQAVGVGLG